MLPRTFNNSQNLERNIFDIKNKDGSCTWEGLANTLKAQTSAEEGLFLKWCVVFEKLPVRHHAPPTPPGSNNAAKERWLAMDYDMTKVLQKPRKKQASPQPISRFFAESPRKAQCRVRKVQSTIGDYMRWSDITKVL